MSEQGSDPFEVLGISPAADLEVVNAAYKVLARRYHPDVAGPDGETAMRRLNWARDELQTDLEGWRLRVAASGRRDSETRRQKQGADGAPATPDAGVPDPVQTWVEMTPQVLFVSGIVGAQVRFSARATGVSGERIKARWFTPAPFEVSRLESGHGWADFMVTVTAPIAGNDSTIVSITVDAPGHRPNAAFVSIAPTSQPIVSQEYPTGRIAPTRHAATTARVSFGKHKGRTFAEVALEEPAYLEWMLRQGAGSELERASATIALGYDPTAIPGVARKRRSGGKKRIRASKGSTAAPAPVKASSAPKQLADPTRRPGLLGAVRSLFGR